MDKDIKYFSRRTYKLTADELKQAVVDYLYEEHGAFVDTSDELKINSDGSAVLVQDSKIDDPYKTGTQVGV